jgi:hypothetical protein
MWSLGREKYEGILSLHILLSQIMDPRRKMSYNQIKMCMCVEYLFGGYPNYTMLFKTYLSLYWDLENFCENMGYLYSHLSFLFLSLFFFLFPLFTFFLSFG